METDIKAIEVDKALQDLQNDLLDWLPLPTALLVFYLFLLVNRIYGFQPPIEFGMAGLVIVTSLVAHELKARWPRLASRVYLGCLAAVAHYLVSVTSSPDYRLSLSVILLL